MSFNPLSLVQFGRRREIHFAAAREHIQVTALQGTRERQQRNQPFRLYLQDDYIHIVHGYGPYSNKHAGVSISLKMWCSPKN